MKEWRSSPATLASFERLAAARPMWTRTAPLDVLVDLPAATLLHAGPPFEAPAEIPEPLLAVAAAAAAREGWRDGPASARAAVLAGEIALRPAQDFGVVTPLAFVVGPRAWCLKVEDAAGRAPARIAPLNDGPPAVAFRFGRATPEGEAYCARVAMALGPALAASLAEPVDILAVMAAGLAGGDDLHGRVTAANAALLARIPPLSPDAAATLGFANQFVLNLLMAGTAQMLAAGAGIPDSALVCAAGGNGRMFGWRRAGEPERWIVRPAAPPAGPQSVPGVRPLPAIGDSAVIDACGFGAASLRFAPEMLATLGECAPALSFGPQAHDAFVGLHPLLPFEGLRLGLDLDSPAAHPGVILAMLDADGRAGLIGRGVAPWPK